MDLTTSLMIDSCVILFMIGAIVQYRLSFYHPLTIYLGFHVLVVSLRILNLHFGGTPLFALEGFAIVTRDEIKVAALLADLGAIAFVVGASIAAARDRRAGKDVRSMELSPEVLRRSAVYLLPVGLFGMASFTVLPGVSSTQGNLDKWGTSSSWLIITSMWPGLLLLAFIYVRGFRQHLVALQTLYLLIMAYQGFHRFRVVLPLIVLVNIYLTRHKLRWPPRTLVVALFIGILAFFPLKSVGRSIQAGDTWSQTMLGLQTSYEGLYRGENEDLKLLDQFASAKTLIDQHGFFYGETYVPLLGLPIPRKFWPGKPGLAQFLEEISTPWRPMKKMGMVTLIYGESYANFGAFGVALVLCLTGFGLSKAYHYAMARPYMSVERFTYILVSASLVQVYRDGLVSLVVFTLVHMMPLFLIIGLHMLIRRQQQHARRRAVVRQAVR